MFQKTKRKLWQTKQGNGSGFTKKVTKQNFASGQTVLENRSKDIIHPKKTCSNTLYATFIKVYVTKEYNRIGGQEVWEDMLQEYSGLIKTQNSDKIFEIWKSINFNEWRLLVVETCVSGLREMYSEVAANALVEAGFDYVVNLEDDEAYQKQLDFIVVEANTVTVVLNQLYIQYNGLLPKNEETTDRKEIDFDKELAILKKHGYGINKRKQSVMEFCAAVNAFLDEVKNMKRHGK